MESIVSKAYKSTSRAWVLSTHVLPCDEPQLHMKGWLQRKRFFKREGALRLRNNQGSCTVVHHQPWAAYLDKCAEVSRAEPTSFNTAVEGCVPGYGSKNVHTTYVQAYVYMYIHTHVCEVLIHTRAAIPKFLHEAFMHPCKSPYLQYPATEKPTSSAKLHGGRRISWEPTPSRHHTTGPSRDPWFPSFGVYECTILVA